MRPDFQILQDGAGGPRLVATEIEACPSSQGVVHAMQRGFGLPEDVADAYAALCANSPLRIVIADAWRVFAWDLLVLCRALVERGIDARVICERPLRVDDWSPSTFGMPRKPRRWDVDVSARLARHGFDALLTRADPPPNALIYRFGYIDTFAARWRRRFRDWSLAGFTFVNPPVFLYDTKALLALADVPSVDRQLSSRQRAALHASLLETRVLSPSMRAQLIDEREHWVLKFAGFDRDERAWGGRSLQVGARMTARAWRDTIDAWLRLPFPCVAQRAAPSAMLSASDAHGRPFQGRSRARAFFVRAGGQIHVCGVHLTLARGRAGAVGVSEGADALQTPIVFK